MESFLHGKPVKTLCKNEKTDALLIRYQLFSVNNIYFFDDSI